VRCGAVRTTNLFHNLNGCWWATPTLRTLGVSQTTNTSTTLSAGNQQQTTNTSTTLSAGNQQPTTNNQQLIVVKLLLAVEIVIF